MAPVNYNHFDGYSEGPEMLTKYRPGETIPGMNAGGWRDAGDDDLRIKSQAERFRSPPGRMSPSGSTTTTDGGRGEQDRKDPSTR